MTGSRFSRSITTLIGAVCGVSTVALLFGASLAKLLASDRTAQMVVLFSVSVTVALVGGFVAEPRLGLTRPSRPDRASVAWQRGRRSIRRT
ncbi:MAG TPA: hypothetical protein VFM54_01210 [Micromonosporaceae bacterium]|nr:hypothetical protein [Micromonosporaceae bacterium]